MVFMKLDALRRHLKNVHRIDPVAYANAPGTRYDDMLRRKMLDVEIEVGKKS